MSTRSDIAMMPSLPAYRVVVIYDDPRGGIWRGPIEPIDKAEERLARELQRVRGSAVIERAGNLPIGSGAGGVS